ncbi:MAG: MgtC/SapB family protein [Clostridia bacterium]|nr:MgtC/SapB family protein [Clostridia bacterium]
MEWFEFQFSPDYLMGVAIRLFAACVLGGIIGFERAYTHHKPAGFRTHILVSLGSCLVMLISDFALVAYKGVANVDPTRIGAQVVSGIGFLGAGAIIRHGFSVKGITTAASIWAVACVGLACGIGFYGGAALATLLIWLVLMYLKIIEERLASKEKTKTMDIEAQAACNVLEPLNIKLKEMGLTVKNLDVTDYPATDRQRIQCLVDSNGKDVDFVQVTQSIKGIEGVFRVSY